jgi:hypothetical protein
MKTKHIYTLIILGLACSTAPEPTYNVNTISNPSEGGVITLTPEQTGYEAGTAVTLTATPNEGYAFIEFTGEFSTTNNPLTVAVGNADMDIVAHFQLKSYPLNIEVEGYGSIIEQIIQNKSTDYDHGTQVQLTANPEYGWEFVEWGGDASGTEPTTIISVDSEKNVTALFQLKRYSLNVLVEGQGTTTIELITEIMPNEEGKYQHGSQVRISATPNEGYRFNTWKGDTTSTESTIVLEMTDDIEITAEFIDARQMTRRVTYERDDNNNVILYTTYNGDGEIEGIQQAYRYDENNRRIETILYNSDGSVFRRDTYIYGENEYQQINYNADSTLNSSNTYLLDENGNTIERKSYDADGNLTARELNSWDNSGNILESQLYDANGNLNNKLIYSYDANGNLLEQAGYYPDGMGGVSLQLKYSYTYNDLNQRIERLIEFTNQGIVSRTTYTYNEEGRMSGFIDYNQDGSLRSSSIYEYDIDNGRVEYYQYDRDGNLSQTRTNLYNSDSYLIEVRYYVIVRSKVTSDPVDEALIKYPELHSIDAQKMDPLFD